MVVSISKLHEYVTAPAADALWMIQCEAWRAKYSYLGIFRVSREKLNFHNALAKIH